MVFPILPANTLAGGYNIANSCRFNSADSAIMHITYSGGASNLKTYTVSFWVKRSKLGARQSIFNNTDGGGSDGVYYDFYADDTLVFLDYGTGAYLTPRFETTQVFRDTSAWYHIVYAVDTTQSTEANRVKIYVNGTRVTAFDVENYPDEDADTLWNRADKLSIGTYTAGGNYFDGYLAEVVHIDGLQLAPTSFGEFDEDSGIWKPIDVSGLTFGDNGFYLDFEDSGDLDDDESGEGNDFTAVNLAATDQTTDTPTNNFCTMNPLDKDGHTNAEGNLQVSGDVVYGMQKGTMGASSGKWYFEARLDTAQNDTAIALANENENTYTKYTGQTANSVGYLTDGRFFYSGSATSYSSLSAGNIFQMAFDADTGEIWIGKNNTWQNSGDPANGTGEVQTVSWNFFLPAVRTVTTGVLSFNFGNPSFAISSGNADANGYGNFEYAVPSGYYALCTKNLAEFG